MNELANRAFAKQHTSRILQAQFAATRFLLNSEPSLALTRRNCAEQQFEE
jgi:hypothetical protein